MVERKTEVRVGDKVTWTSQSGGSWKEKTGEVIAEIPAGESAMRHLPDYIKKSHIKFCKDFSTYDRVLVAVPSGKDGKITHYYCPIKSSLKK